VSPEAKKPVRPPASPPRESRARPRPEPKKPVAKKGPPAVRPPSRRPPPLPRPRVPDDGDEPIADEAPPVRRVARPPAIARPGPRVRQISPDDDEADDENDVPTDEKAKTPVPAGRPGDVPAGRDPAADEEGYIPLTEALRRLSGGKGTVPNIVPNWIASNFSQDGEVGLDEFRQIFMNHINRFRVYPAGWSSERDSGTVQVAGNIDGQTGQLMSVWLVASSGLRELDRAALQTIVRANPYPPIGTPGVLRFQVGLRFGGDELSPR
jgi:TonB family protein